MDLHVLAPDVNVSEMSFTPDPSDPKVKTIRFGLGAIKGLGEKPIEAILEARKDGPFSDLYEFCQRINVKLCPKASIELLVQAGGFDSLHTNRAQATAYVDPCFKISKKDTKDRDAGQYGMFDGLLDPSVTMKAPDMPDVPQMDDLEQLKLEKQLLGVYISDHPYDKERHRLDGYDINPASEIADMENKDYAVAAGLVSHIRPLRTKTGKDMAFISIEDDMGTTQVIVFPTCFAKCSNLIVMDELVVIRGKIQRKSRGRGREMVAEEIVQIDGGDNIDNFGGPATSDGSGLKQPARIPAILPIPTIVGATVPPRAPDKPKMERPRLYPTPKSAVSTVSKRGDASTWPSHRG
jgi:DNA polymerase-3 subunit alpha